MPTDAKKIRLTPRDYDIINLAAQGLTDQQIANQLGLSRGTVIGYWSRIRLKLQVSSRTEAVSVMKAQALKASEEKLSKTKNEAELLKRHSSELEEMVRQRTAQLSAANRELQQEVARRAEVERALRASEDKYRNLYERAEAALFRSTIDGRRMLEANAKALELFESTRRQLINKATLRLWDDPSDREALMSKLLEKGRVQNYPCVLKPRDRVKHCLVNAILDRDQGTVEWSAVDITDRILARRAIEKNARRMRLMLDLHQRSASLDDNAFFRAVIDIAVELTDSSVGFFHKVSEEDGEIRLTVWNQCAQENCSAPADTHYPLDQAGIWADCVKSGKAVIVNDYNKEPRRHGMPEGHSVISRFLSVPVVVEGKTTAIFGVGNKKQPFDEGDVQQIEHLAQDVQILIDNRKLHAELVQAESEVRRKLDALVRPGSELEGIGLRDLLDMSEADKMLRMLTRVTGLQAGILDPEGIGYAGSGWQEVCEKFHRASTSTCRRCLESDRLLAADIHPGCYKLYKCLNNLWEMATPLSIGEKVLGHLVIGQFFFDDEPIDWDLYAKQAEQFGFDKQAYLESLAKVPRISREYVQSAITLFSSIVNRLIDQCHSKLQVAKALHDRQKYLDAVLQAEEKFRVAFETSPDSVTLHRLRDGAYLDVNDGACKISGYRKTELIGKTWFDINLWVDPADGERLKKGIEEQGLVENFRAKVKGKDGTVRHKLISGSKLIINGEPCMLAVGRDVTEMVLAEERLRRSQRDLSEAARIAKIARWEFDVQADRFMTSDGIFQLLGNQPPRDQLSFEDVLKYLHPEDRPTARQHHGRLMAEGSAPPLDIRVCLPDGSTRWLRSVAEAVLDENGRITKVVGTVQDVTEQKVLEEQARESTERFRAIAENTPDILFEHDLDLRYTFLVNPLFGHTVEEVLGKTDFDLFDEAKARELTEAKRQVLQTGRPLTYRNSLTKNNQTRFFEGSYVPRFDAEGKVCGLFGYFRDVTETVQLIRELAEANQGLQDSQRQLAGVLESLPDAIFRFDGRRKIVYASSRAGQLAGLDPERLLGKGIQSIGWLSDFSGRIDRALQRSLKTGALQDFEIVAGMTGGAKHLGWRLMPEKDDSGKTVSVLAVVRDLSDMRKAEQDLATLFNQMLDGFALHEIILDDEGRPCDFRFLDVNPAFERMTGLNATEIIGRTVLEVLPGNEPFWIETFGRVALTGEPAHFENYSKALDKHLEVAAFQTAPMHFACVFADVTDRVRAVAELREYQRELERKVEHRTAELTEAISELESFSYSVSHDLRAPLRALSGFSQILKQDYSGKLDEDGEYLLDRISHSAEHMSHLIDGLLRLSRISRANLCIEKVCLSDLCFGFIEAGMVIAEGTEIDWRIEPGVYADCDAQLAESLLDNLLGNAVKYTAKVKNPVVHFGTCQVDGHKVFFVKDNGEGFDMAYAERLFKPFQRLHRQDEYEGLGIGLATAKRIVARHGGRIWAESAPDAGTTFYFTLSPEAKGNPFAEVNSANKNGRGDTI